MYSKELKLVSQKEVCISIFTAALFIAAKIRKQLKRLSIDEWIAKMWYTHPIWNIIQPRENRKFCHWQQHGGSGRHMLSDISQTKTNTVYHITYIWDLKKLNL